MPVDQTRSVDASPGPPPVTSQDAAASLLRVATVAHGIRTVLLHGPAAPEHTLALIRWAHATSGVRLVEIPANADEAAVFGDAGWRPRPGALVGADVIVVRDLAAMGPQLRHRLIDAVTQRHYLDAEHRPCHLDATLFAVHTGALAELSAGLRDRFDIGLATPTPTDPHARVRHVDLMARQDPVERLRPGGGDVPPGRLAFQPGALRWVTEALAERGVPGHRAARAAIALAVGVKRLAASGEQDPLVIDRDAMLAALPYVLGHRDVFELEETSRADQSADEPEPPDDAAEATDDSPQDPSGAPPETTAANDGRQERQPPDQSQHNDRRDDRRDDQTDDGTDEAPDRPSRPDEAPSSSEPVPVVAASLVDPTRGRPGQGRAGGKRARVVVRDCRGRVVRTSVRPSDPQRRDISVIGTLTHLIRSGRWPMAGPTWEASATGAQSHAAPVRIDPEDLRYNVRAGRTPYLVVFVVDTSGSMAAKRRFRWARGAVRGLLGEAYRARDRVSLITFAGDCATLVLPPTRSPDLADRLLGETRLGGRTPLGHALQVAWELLERELRRDPAQSPYVVLVTDGRANVPLDGDTPMRPVDEAIELSRRLRERFGPQSLVIDGEAGFLRFGLAERLADALGAPLERFGEVSALPGDRVGRAAAVAVRGRR